MDIRDGRVVKGIKFQGLRDAGDPEELARLYEHQNADEIVFLDVSATPKGRSTGIETVRRVRRQLSIPLTVGGGVRVWQDAKRLLEAGADKVAVNTAAVENPDLLSQIASRFGRQCTVLAVDAKTVEKNRWQVVVRSGKEETGIDVIQWAKDACEKGAGEILLTSWDRDGTGSGYDLELVSAVADSIPVPVIASGGASTFEQLRQGLLAGAEAILAATIFHDGITTVGEIKHYLAEKNMEVRL